MIRDPHDLGDVLVVDGDDEARARAVVVMRSLVARSVREADSSYSGVALLARHDVDLVLTEILVPGGAERLVEAANSKATMTIVMTDRASRRQVANIMRAGALGYVDKPVNTESLCRVLNGTENAVRRELERVARAVRRSGLSIAEAQREITRVTYEEAMSLSQGDRGQAAELLGLTPTEFASLLLTLDLQ